MNSEVEEQDLEADIGVDDDDVALSADDDLSDDDDDVASDNVGDVSVEINVEELIAKIEGEGSIDAARRKEIRRRLEELAEEKALDDTYSFDLNEEL